MTTHIDWSGLNGSPRAGVGEPMPCQHCGQPAFLRHPATGKPCHKACAEQDIDRIAAAHGK